MKALDRKLLRDLRLMWSQALTIALVVASGVAGFITSFSAYDALSWSRDLYYAEARFANVFASLKRAPRPMERQLQAIPGAAHVETSLSQIVPITIPNVADPIIGRLIGIDARSPQRLNKVHLRAGRMIEARRPDAIEAGVARLIGTDTQAILDHAQGLLDDPVQYRAMARGVSPYGDGQASRRIVEAIKARYCPEG